jgi:PAS domain S-box-containing protein
MEGNPPVSLASARCRLLARRLPAFAAMWLGTAVVWSIALRADGLASLPGSIATLAAQAAILAGAIAVCRADPGAWYVIPAVGVAAVLLGLTTIGRFAAVAGSADFLAFVLLTLYLLAALLFAWGWRAELALLVLTAVPWGLALARLRLHVPPVELAAAIMIGSTIALALAEGAARTFALAFRHRAAEEASRRELEVSRNAYRDLAEQAHEPIFASDLAGRFTYVNAALARCLGEPESALVGRAVAQFLTAHPGNRDVRELLAGIPGGDAVLPVLEFEAETAKGPRWFETQPSVVRDATGHASGLRAICRDVTERKQLERERDAVIVREHAARIEAETARLEAERAARARDEFLAMLSHELRSPLGAILTWTRMLRRGLVERSRVPDALASMEEAAKAQERLVADLLDISRIAAGKLSLQMERVDPAEILAACLEAARAAAATKDIALEERVDRGVGAVRADATRLRQVFENLLSNALKFTEPGGRVTVTLERAGGEACVTVRDTGIGIPPHVVPHVFDQFRQADSSITRRYGGLGLGLAIARRLVEAHGGRIEAESRGTGQGATFRVRLPLAAGPVAFRPGSPATAPSRLDGLDVLVVEDDPQSLDVFTTLLARHGADVRPAASVREAVAGVAERAPDVVVTDLAMPDEDGWALVRRLRELERERGRHVPVIVVSALASTEDRERSASEGVEEHLTKPVDPAELVAAVARNVATGR